MTATENFFSILNCKLIKPIQTELNIQDVTTDMNDNNYILVIPKKPAEEYEREVQVWKKAGDMLHTFPVGRAKARRGWDGRGWNGRGWDRLTASNTKVLVSKINDEYNFVVSVYQHDGGYVCSFGEGILKNAEDITVDKGGHVMVLDSVYPCVHVFTDDGTRLNEFNYRNWMPKPSANITAKLFTI